jgi:hypothetical protein
MTFIWFLIVDFREIDTAAVTRHYLITDTYCAEKYSDKHKI